MDPSDKKAWDSFVDSVRAKLTVKQVVDGVRSGATVSFDYVTLILTAEYEHRARGTGHGGKNSISPNFQNLTKFVLLNLPVTLLINNFVNIYETACS